MMDFARSLAPLRDNDVTRAAPVLPSRFGGESPLQLAPARPLEEEAEAGTPTSVRARAHAAAAPPASRGAPQAHDPARSPAVHTAPMPPHHERAQARGTQSVPAEAVRAGPDPAPRATRVLLPPEPKDADASAASRPLNDSHEPASRALPVAPSPARNDAASRHPPRRPISEAALAARHAATAEAPPVVHVTIDRIDVRAPTAPPTPAPAARARAAAPSVSLADYLRRGAPKPGGLR